MLTSQRHAHILDRLSRDGQIVATRLALELGLSEDTIRRDLRELAGEGKLKRVHGGALPLSPDLPDLAERETIAADVKQALGRRAAALIAPGMVVFLDGGSTNAALVAALPRSLTVTIVTHSPTIAAALAGHDAEVILLGGRLYKHSMVTTGAAVVEALAALRVDLFFLGATALHPVHGATTGDYEEAQVKRAIAARADATWLMAAEPKFDRVSPHRILPLADLQGLVIPAGLEEARISPYAEAGLEIVTA
ncbi:DeoR/GlpR family DNA-binding transcription regulator [Rhizobium sp. CC-YZS058]|uniref:DeoR/GlpR family DNA-binding transcription regulator n=1 Tax=Rhizobium sp. CC-YZS058 TaxID=3042153 RepID=UPI002B05ED7C|nr:DeoR/GlpR family DNA-binding transcription regulator [Rhizobium sp. CC-YZS058]MEA3535613.1 DeoR/GlpR family DNA-binding transcription regulator [Rhizobium sp. CC-YZS058]